MKRFLIFAYGLASYAVFFATFLYAIGFVGNLLVPKGIDSAPQLPFVQALLVNLGLLGVFAVQHSVMARPFFKRWITRFIPASAERSTFVLFASLALILLFWFWQPMGVVIWDVESVAGQALLLTGFVFGWSLVLVSTFLINHFDLFGLRQVWLQLRGKPYTPVEFVMPLPYRMIRHPLYFGFLCAFWFTPTMTVAHLVFAAATTAYILLAIRFEEHDLQAAHPEYRTYRKQVPMILPGLPRTLEHKPAST
jgi:protein-S-isoprenylcysteine O-methyltransferase Ste14